MLRKEDVCRKCSNNTALGCADMVAEELRFCPWMKYEYDMGGEMNGGWISVAEKLPEMIEYDNGYFSPCKQSDWALVTIPPGLWPAIVTIAQRRGNSLLWYTHDCIWVEVSHWMPLPQLPATYRQKKGA